MYSKEAFLKELKFKAIRSSGSGGQHVNKVSSKIELSFNLEQSLVFNEEQKQRVAKIKQQQRTHGERRAQHRFTRLPPNPSTVVARSAFSAGGHATVVCGGAAHL